VDVRTFGGPESNVNPAVNAGPILSRRGTAVGGSATSVSTSPHSHPFVCGGLEGSVPFVFHAFKWQDGAVSDLGALPPDTNNCSEAQGVNERGEIALQSENGAIDPLTGINEVRAARWKNGEIEELGTFGGNNSLANEINSSGQIAGAASNTISDLWFPEIRIWLIHWELSVIRFVTPASTLMAILAAVRDCLRTRAALQIEVLALRHQLNSS